VLASGVRRALFLLVVGLGACAVSSEDAEGAPGVAAESDLSRSICATISAPPAALGLDPFYGKYCDAAGIPVVAASVVPDAALRQAARLTAGMLAPIPKVRAIFVKDHIRVAVIGEHQRFGDIPENAAETRAAPARFADKRADGALSPGAAGTPDPVVSDGEENLMCYERDGFDRGENNLVHELAHNIKTIGLQALDAGFEATVKAAFDAAKASGKYAGHYAGTTPEEYWAEGVQDYFDVHGTHDPTDVNTGAQLKTYDPTLYAIIDGVFRNAPLPPSCPAPPFSPTQTYRLRNVQRGAGASLDVTSLHPSGNFSGQRWTIAATGSGCFRLTNAFTGAGQSLDVTDMHPTGAYSGQCWRFSEVTGGSYRLTNDFLGASRSLEATAGGVAMGGHADVAAQLWMVTPFD
jgi:hypothetical protein